MKKCTIILLIAAALIFQVAVTEQVYARGGCRENINYCPGYCSALKSDARGAVQYYAEDCEFCYDFGGIGLKRSTSYTLVVLNKFNLMEHDSLTCIGTGCTNKYGQVHIYGCEDTGDICFKATWLVLTCDIEWDSCSTGHLKYCRSPQWYLYGTCLVNYLDMDD